MRWKRDVTSGDNLCVTLSQSGANDLVLHRGDGTTETLTAPTYPASASFCHTYTKTRFYDVYIRNPEEVTSVGLSGSNVQLFRGGPAENLKKLNLHNNQISSLTGIDHLSGLQTLDLGHNPIPTLESGSLSQLTNLTRLDMSQTAITQIPAGLFDSLTSLSILKFGGQANVTSVPSGLFDSLTNLLELEFGGGGRTTLPDGLFDQLTGLMVLDLSNGLITSLPTDIFEELIRMHVLSLSGNHLRDLPTIPGTVASLRADANCIGSRDASTGTIDILTLRVGPNRENNQLLCPDFTYSPAKPLTGLTPGPIIATVKFYGPLAQEALFTGANPSLPYQRTFIDNETATFDYSGANSQNLLKYTAFTATVDRMDDSDKIKWLREADAGEAKCFLSQSSTTTSHYINR